MSRRAVGALQAAGLAGTVLGFAWLHATRLATEPYPLWGSFQLGWSTLLIALLALSSYAVGLPELAGRRAEVVLASSGAYAFSVAVVSMAQLAMGYQLMPRSVVFVTGAVVPLWSLLVWNLAGDARSRDEARARVLVVARDPEEVAALRGDLAGQPERPAVIVDHLDPAVAAGSGDARPLLEVAARTRPTVVVLDATAQGEARIVEQAAVLHQAGIRFRTMSLFYELWLGKLPVGELHRVALLFDIGEIHRARYTRVKRVIDVACAVVGLIVVVPVVAVVATLNVVLNPGPLFFRQQRVGKGGRPFVILKFRSMVPSRTGRQEWTRCGDDRVGAFGRFLRRSHLDELPQVLNILRGDLSIVGPRPEQVPYVEELRTKLPFYDSRHLVRPGLTGWAQVKFGYAASEGDALEKLQYDIYYLRRQGIGLDLRILVRTLRAVGRGFGR
jgi:lipopolysaccharide/colanic/teichoic acid biosynthesis glycosyltransferase